MSFLDVCSRAIMVSHSPYSSSIYSSSCDPWQREWPAGANLMWPSLYAPAGLGGGPLSEPWVAVIDDDLYVSFSDLSVQSGGRYLEHRRTYCSLRRGGGRSGELGAGWFLADFPYMVDARESLNGRAEMTVVGGCASRVAFQPDDDGGWAPAVIGDGVLEHDMVGRSFSFTRESGAAIVFESFDHGLPRQIRGRLKSIHMEDGALAEVGYSAYDLPSEVNWYGLDDSVQFIYSDADENGHPDRLSSVTLLVNGQPVQRVAYQYFNSSQRAATHDLLKGTNTERWDGGFWIPERRVLFKYARTSVQLREIKVWQVSSGPCPTDAEAGSHVPVMDAEMTRYKVQYNPFGKVAWIQHDGPGTVPQFFD